MREPPDLTPLTGSTLSDLDARVTVPRYDRADLQPGIVHIGVGGFHRAHLATYVDDLCTQGVTDWSIIGAGVLSQDSAMAEALRAQDHLYSLIARGAEYTDVRIIGSIVDYILADGEPAELIDAIADVHTQIVSMTITEGGYPVDDVTTEFCAEQSLAGGVFDILVRGLDARRSSGIGPITVMSCDNVMTNGQVARTATIGEAQRRDPELSAWIVDNVSFPNSMVDRITPTTTLTDKAWLADEYHLSDRWPVVAEPFRQWVVEDDFAGNRLPLEQLDVIVTDDIEPYELTKLRMLNAGHSCLAYLAALDGFELVDEAMADPGLHHFVTAFLHEEAKPTMPHAHGIDLDDYADSLLERFSNPGIGDQIARLCLDGSAKFPKFLVPTIRTQLDAGGPIARSALALAGWCEYLATSDEQSGTAPAADPHLDVAIEYARRSLASPEAFLEFAAVFGDDLPRSDRFVDTFVRALTTLRDGAVQSALAAMTADSPR